MILYKILLEEIEELIKSHKNLRTNITDEVLSFHSEANYILSLLTQSYDYIYEVSKKQWDLLNKLWYFGEVKINFVKIQNTLWEFYKSAKHSLTKYRIDQLKEFEFQINQCVDGTISYWMQNLLKNAEKEIEKIQLEIKRVRNL